MGTDHKNTPPGGRRVPIDEGAPEVASLLTTGGLNEVFIVYEPLSGSYWKEDRATESYLANTLGAVVFALGDAHGIGMFLKAGRASLALVGSKEKADAVYSQDFWNDGSQRPYVYELKNGVPSLYLTPDRDVPGETGMLEGDADSNHFDSPDGSATIDGKGGSDTVSYGGTRDKFEVKLDTGGAIIVTKPTGTDTLISIERIEFSDGTLLFDIDSDNAAAAYRLYGGAFDRTPDEGGLLFWIDYLDSGGALRDAATAFLGSAEFVLSVVRTFGTTRGVN